MNEAAEDHTAACLLYPEDLAEGGAVETHRARSGDGGDSDAGGGADAGRSGADRPNRDWRGDESSEPAESDSRTSTGEASGTGETDGTRRTNGAGGLAGPIEPTRPAAVREVIDDERDRTTD